MRFPILYELRALRDDQVDRLEVEVLARDGADLELIARGLYQVIEHMSLALLIYQEIVI